MGFPAPTPAVKLLLLVNGVVFLANALLVGRLSDPGRGGGAWLAVSWPALLEGYGLGALRLLSYQFTHSFADPWHLLMNMLVLYFFGTMAEARLGCRGTCMLYVFGGIAGAALHVVIAALRDQLSVPLVGASGACYALLVYAACMAPRAAVILFVVPVPMWGLAVLLVGIGAYSTFVEFATGAGGSVSHGAHLGGAALGFLAFRHGWFRDLSPAGGGDPLSALIAAWRRRRAAGARRAAERRELQLDAILAKVKEHGIGALTQAERRFLEQAREHARKR